MIFLNMAALASGHLVAVPGGRDPGVPVFAGGNKVKEAVKAFTQRGTSYLIITL